MEFFKITQEEQGERLDTYLVSKNILPTRTQVQKLILQEKIKVNGFPSKSSYRVKFQDVVSVEIPEPSKSVIEPQEIPLDILYEDTDVVVVNKPAGMVVHPGTGNKEGTLVNALLHHCKNLSGIGGVLRPGIVHRLDKDTSGVMVVAKNDQAHLHLSEQFKKRTIGREYQALIFGRMKEDEGNFNQPIGRHPHHRKKMSSKAKKGKEAKTYWKVLKKYDQLSLIQANLATGRTHQIRVHFSEAGHPVVGDTTYGGKNRIKNIINLKLRQAIEKLPAMLLHAKTLSFEHPKTHKRLIFKVPRPDYFDKILNIL